VIDRVESVNDSVLVAIKNLDAKDAGVSSIDYGKFVLEGAIIVQTLKLIILLKRPGCPRK